MDSAQSANPTLELIEQGATVMRVENENLQAMAIQKPRDIQGLTKAAIDELRAFPKFAEKMYYSIPYKETAGSDGPSKPVEGPGIKAANALARHWGNNSSGFRIIGSDNERINIQGVFIDHETGMRRTAEITVSRLARSKKGETYALNVRRLDMAIQAGGSKAVRNAILNALPIGLVETYYAESKMIAARGGKTVGETPEVDAQNIMDQIELSVKSFETKGVERAEVQAYVARHPELDSEEKVSAHLIGLLNALDEQQTTIEEIFTVPDSPIAEPQRRVSAAAPITPAPQAPPPAAAPLARRTTPPSNPPAQEKKTMVARFDAGTCVKCRKPILKGQTIMKDDLKQWIHETH